MPYINFLKRHTVVLLLCVSVVVLVCVSVVHGDETPYSLRTLYVFPSSVTTTSWVGVEKIYSQEYDDHALYQDFRKSGAAYLDTTPVYVVPAPVPESTTDTVGTDRTDAVSDPETSSTDAIDIQAPSSDSEISDAPIDAEVDAPVAPPVAPPSTSEDETSTPEPLPEAATEPAAQTESSEPPAVEPLTKAEGKWSLVFAQVFERALSVFASTETEITSSTSDPTQGSANVALPQDEPTSDIPTVVENELPVVPENVPDLSPIATSTSDVQTDAVESDSQTAEPSNDLAESVSPYFCEGQEGCAVSPIVFDGFALPELGSGEFIEDAQLRLSFAGKPKKDFAGEDQGLVIEYMLDGAWNEAGTVPLNEEVSNAINGGYYLFALPAIDSVARLSNLHVRVTYYGNPENLEGIYVDSLWLELGVQSIDEASLRAHVLPDALEELKKPAEHELLSTELDFTLDELPNFTLKYIEQRNAIIQFFRSIFADKIAEVTHVILVHEDFGDVGVEPELFMTDEGLWTIKIPESEREKMRPGLYSLQIEVAEGNALYRDSFEFQWGLLALNVNKSEYVVGETARISLAALSQNGNTICDASLSLYVIAPDNFIQKVPVVESGLCKGNNVVDVPDYAGTFVTSLPGTHTFYVERLDPSGDVIAHTEDTFEVVSDAPISIERSGPTRIYPVAPYTMSVTVSARAAFTGTFVDIAPHDYEISNTDAIITVEDDKKKLTWDIALLAGESKTFTYTFDSPDISPYLYMLGPASVLLDGDISTMSEATPTDRVEPQMTEEIPIFDDVASTSALDSVVPVEPLAEPTPVEQSNAENVDVPVTPLEPTLSVPTESENTVVAPSAETDTTPESAPLEAEVIPEDASLSETPPLILPSDTETLFQSTYVEEMGSTTGALVDAVDTGRDAVAVVRSFTEHRRWQIASDATGSMIVLWTDGASIPSGWTCISCNATQTAFQRFPKGGATYGTTGGVSTSTHTASGTVAASAAVSSENRAGTEVAISSHAHTYDPVIVATSTLPGYRQLRLIQNNSAGQPASLPAGVVLMFDSTVPSGWARYSQLDDRFPYGENTILTAGTSTHRHSVIGTTTGASGSTVDGRTLGTQVKSALAGHQHIVNGTTTASSNEPPFITVIYGTTTVATTTPVNAITMWTDTPPAGWLNRSATAGDPFYDVYPKGSASYGSTGGSLTHSHSDLVITSSTSTEGSVSRVGTAGTPATSTHDVTISNIAYTDHQPPYVTAIFAKYLGANPTYTQLAYRWFANLATSTTPTDAWPAGSEDLITNEQIGATNTPVKSGDVVRLRMQVGVSVSTSTAVAFKLQFGSTTAECSAITTWTDVGASTSTVEWRGYDNGSLSDGAVLSSSTILGTDTLESYEENNPSTTTPNDIGIGEEGEWDFVLEQNGAYEGSTYCFRMVKSDGTVFFAYDNYPSLWTNEAPDLPTQAVPFNNEKVSSTTPLFEFSGGDTESDTLTYQIQVDDDYAFTSVTVDRNSVSHGSQFEDLTLSSNKDPFPAGDDIEFHLTSALTNGTTYYWRVRAKDPTGSNQWGSWSTIRSFTIDTTVTISTWHQTMEEQFDTDTLYGTDALAADTVELIVGSTTGTTTSSAITFSEGSIGNAWGSLSFNDTEATGDIKYHIEYFDSTTATWQLVPDGSLSGNAAGFDATPVSLLGVDVETYPIIRVAADFTNIAGTPTLSDWTVAWGYRVETPTINSLFSHEKTATTTPTFEFYTTDPQNDDLQYEFQWSTTSAFTSSTTRTSGVDSGFVNITTATDTSSFISGDIIQFTIQPADALQNNQTYWWRVRARDPAPGANVYSFYTDARSVTASTSVTVSTWFQTTVEQFSVNTNVGIGSVSTTTATVSTTTDDALVAYAEGAVTTPRYRTWDGTTWSAEGTAVDVGATINWVVTKNSPDGGEYALATMGSDADVNVQVFNDGTWDNLQEITASIPNTNMRGFDIAYETLSGDLMVVACDGDSNPTYWIWDGSWTNGGGIGLTGGNTCGWVKLISDPISDEIIAITRDTTGITYEARVWSGNGWANSATWGSIQAADVNKEGIAAAYEESGDQAVIAVANGSAASFSWRTWDGLNWAGASVVNSAIGNDFEWGTLAADQGSDNMTLCYVDTDNDIGYKIWTGAGWSAAAVTEVETTNGVDTDRRVDCVYETRGARDGRTMIAYNDTASLKYRFYNAAISGEGTIATTTTTSSSTVQLRRTGDGKILEMNYNNTFDRYDFSYWYGTLVASSTWNTPAQTLESNASNNAIPFREPFMMAAQNPSTGGVMTGEAIDFDDGSGPYWQQFSWVDSEPSGSTLVYQVEYYDESTSEWTLVPNGLIAGNSSGTTTSPINLTSVLPVTTYNQLRPKATFTCNLGVCPTLSDWTITWAAGITVSGTAHQYDQSSNVTSGTVAVALNGTLQVGKTGTIAAGTWSIANVNAAPGDTVTVFVQGAATNSRAVGVTTYDGVGDISGMNLYERHVSLGSNDNGTTTNYSLSRYDNTNTNDIFYNVDASNDLTVCAIGGCEDAELILKAGNLYQPGAGADIVTHDFENNGTFLINGNTMRVSGSWDNNATATLATSTLIFTATSTSENFDDTGAVAVTYNNLTFGETSGTASWTVGSNLDIDGNLTTSFGTLARNTRVITVAGNLTNNANGLWSGTSSTTFDGSTAATWTDNAVSKANIGKVLIDGTSKTVTLGNDVKAESIIIGADDILDASITGFDIQLYKNWTNNNTFTARTGLVQFSATSTGNVITPGSSSFYDISFDGPGAWSVNATNITVGNDFTVSTGTITLPTGTTTVAGTWNSTGGLFAHNNGAVTFSSSAAEVITLAGSAFTNTFYNLAFTGSGSWSFGSANATTSNNLFVSAGTVTFPSGIMALGGSLIRSGGSITANSGTLQLTAATAKTLETGGSALASILVTGGGSWSFVDTNLTAAGNLTVSNGTLTLPSGTLTLGGSFTNTATVTHNSGTVLFNSTTTGRTINPGSSSLYNVTLNSTTGGWTIGANATATNAFTLTNASSFTLSSGFYLSVGGTFTNSVGGASTTWTGSRLALVSNTAYAINTKTNNGDLYDTMILTGTTSPNMWFSSSTVYTLSASSSLYSQDHFNVDGSLYIFGAYARTSGTEYWNYSNDFDGTTLSGVSQRQVNVRFASGSTAAFSSSTLSIVGTSTASTTIAAQSGTYTLSVAAGTTTASYYAFSNLGLSGLTLGTSTKVTTLSDGSFTAGINSGTTITVSSSTIDANPALQIFRVNFATTTAISATNVTQTIGTPTSYWWFRSSTGNLDGEFYDNDSGDPGSIRWDDSNLTITVGGTIYDSTEVTPLGLPTCDGFTAVVSVVVDGGTSYTGTCSAGVYSIPNVVIAGDPVLTVYLNTNGGVRATTITQTPTTDISNLNLFENRIVTRHENTDPLTIADMAVFDESNDTDIRFDAATGSAHTLTVRSNTELHVASSTTFVPGGTVTLTSGGTGTTYDGSLHIDDLATFTGAGTTTYSIGGGFAVDTGATFTSGSSTVAMTATTTGKSITTPGAQSITFHDLQFTGVGGGWSADGDIIVNGSSTVSTGTLSGTKNITIENGYLTGNGTVALTGGTVTIKKINVLGGTQPWTFNNLTLGNGSVVGTTTRASNATTTVSGVLTVAAGHKLSMGTSQWNLAGGGTPLSVVGILDAGTGTVRYSATTSANIVSTTYYNLDLNASANTPTYTATGLGITVQGGLSVGGAANTTVNFDTNDAALAVTGSVLVRSGSTLVGSNSGSFTVGGSWDNDGTFTSSGGTVSFVGSGAPTIAAGASSFGTLTINGTGSFTVTENATGTTAVTLTAASAFTVNSGITLAVGGTFSNGIGGAATTWTGSILSLYGGGNYQINASTTNDIYATLRVDANTDIRMWNSSATTVSVDSTGSLYSQDHAAADGALYIYGDYYKSSGTDYWSYATDFDGTTLGGSSRAVTVSFAPNATATISGGTLNIVGGSAASTTMTRQSTGNYALIVNAGTLNAQYYVVRHINANGLVLTNTPTITTLSNGDFEVSQNSASALTVGGTVIDQNPAKTFSANAFGTSTGISPAFNVTATGTTISSWRFTNHTGTIDGEFYNVDPGGDPGYIVWDDSAGTITVSGNVYSDEGTTPIGAGTCNGSSNVHLVVQGVTSYTTTCNAGSGLYTIPGVAYSPGDTLIVYLDTNGGAQAANVTVDPLSSIGNMHLYQNRVIVRHEDTNPITIADMALYDSSDDADVQFTAVDAGSDTLSLPADRKLIVWNSKSFAPAGNVTITGGGAGADYDGTLELLSNAQFVAAGTQSHTIGGSLISGVGATITGAQATFTMTTTGAARTFDTNNGTLYNVTFNGAGSWVMSDTTFTASNDFSISAGAVTLPTATTTIGGSFLNTGGTFYHSSGTLAFTATASGKTVRVISDMYRTLFNGSGGAWSFFNPHATATASFAIDAGTVTMPSGTLVDGGAFTVSGGAFTHNSGVVKLTATTSSTSITTNGSDFHSLTISSAGGGYSMNDTSVDLLGTLRITQGTLAMATGTVSIGGSLLNTGGTFAHSSGTILFNSSDTGESITPGSSIFNTVSLASASGGWTITGHATTAGSFSLTSATQFTMASNTKLYVAGVFTNTVGGSATTWDGSILEIPTGTNYTINTALAGGDRYNTLMVGTSTDLRMWNSSATTTTVDASGSLYSQDHAAVNGALYIYGDYGRTSGTDYWSYATDFDGTALGGSPRAVTVSFASNATATFTGATLNVIGVSTASTTITNQGSGTYALTVDGGTLNAQYYRVRNGNADGLILSGLTTITSLAYGDFELATSGGSLITLSSSTLNANASIVVTGMRFATTTAITGSNVELVGTTPSAWTFTSHTGNLAGENFDVDGGDDCGSLRWTDSTCLITEQTHYRWRNDDGGESVPDTEWYNVSWTKRKRINITNLDATVYTDAVVEIPVTFDSDMQADFDDLRITDSSGTTSIPYWIETYTLSTNAVVWVKVPSLAASDATSIFMYYGNGGVQDMSSGTTTFSTFDDFEDANITEYSGDTSLFTTNTSNVYERTRRLEASNVNGRTTDGIYNTSVTTNQGKTIRYFQYVDTTSGSGDEACTLFGVQAPGTNNQNYAVCLELFGIDRVSLAKNVYDNDSNGTVLASSTITYATGWHEVEIRWTTGNSIGVTVSRSGVEVATTSVTDASYTTGGIGYTFWFAHGGWDTYTVRPLLTTEPTVTFGVEQVSGGASWYADLDTAASGVSIDTTKRVRFVIENSGLTISNQNFRLDYAEKGAAPSCESVSSGSYAAVPNVASCGTSPMCMKSSTQYTNLASTTDQLTGDGTFTYGQIIEDPSNKTGNLTVQASEFTEVEYALAPTSFATDPSYCFRISNDGSGLDSYTRVAEMALRFDPTITSWSFNSGQDIVLSPGATTTIYATGTVSDQNGYADLLYATSTFYRSAVGPSCTADNNNCYQVASTSCSFTSCSGNSCDLSCSAGIYFFADPTDAGTYVAQDWRADVQVDDQSSGADTQSTFGSDMLTLRALAVDSSIAYGSVEVSSDTGAYTPTTTVENIGNDAIDITLNGTDLSDGVASTIPVATQKYATSTFSYGTCTYCTLLSAISTAYEVDLSKPTTTTPVLTDDIYWGISIPFGASAAAHEGLNTFIATGD